MLAWHVYKKVDPNRWNTCFKFAFVRNPGTEQFLITFIDVKEINII